MVMPTDNQKDNCRRKSFRAGIYVAKDVFLQDIGLVKNGSVYYKINSQSKNAVLI